MGIPESISQLVVTPGAKKKCCSPAPAVAAAASALGVPVGSDRSVHEPSSYPTSRSYAVGIDHPELPGRHVERVLDLADGDARSPKLVAKRPNVRAPAVEEHCRCWDASIRAVAGERSRAPASFGSPAGLVTRAQTSVPPVLAAVRTSSPSAFVQLDGPVHIRHWAYAVSPWIGTLRSCHSTRLPCAVRRYFVTTFGCQMNAHDSERIKGMLEELGLGEAPTPEDADVVVFNTCTIREKPDTKLAAYLGEAAARKRRDPDRVIAVGGCYAEAQRERIFELYPDVDVAFGPGSIAHLADWLGAGGVGVARGRFGLDDRAFAATLPMHRERPFQAWVQVSMGCNSTCAYCIVPAVRGREQSRRPGEIVAEVTGLAAEGVKEITLLGQNVNSWGRDLAPDIRTEFGELLRACDAVDGIERIRFTSPHPKDFREPVISAIAECDAVCEQIHLPLQSGSSRVLKAMRRTYTRERYLALVERLRAAIPDLALGTDIIVGFPGETDARVRRDARGRRGGRLRQRLHVRLLAAPRHRGGRDGRPGTARAQDRAHGAPRRADAAHRRRAERRARRPHRAGARRGAVAHRRARSCGAAPGATRP